MKIYLVVSCWLLSVVCVKVSAVIPAYGVVGREASIMCQVKTTVISTEDKNKYFCKDECSGRDVLVNTDGSKSSATKGRYSIHDKGDGSFTVTISRLIKSDSGTYWCGVDGYVTDPRQEVKLTVTNAPPKSSTPRPRETVSTMPSNVPTTSNNLSTTSIKLSTSQTSQHLSDAASFRPGLVVYAIVGLVVTVTVLGLALLVFYRKRRGGNMKSPESSNNLANTAAGQDDCVYEDVGEEDRQTDSLPAVDSTVYSTVKSPSDSLPAVDSTVYSTVKSHSDSLPAVNSAVYSTVKPRSDRPATAPASQDTVSIPNDMYANVSFPNDAIDLTYSMVDFPKGGQASVIYSTVSLKDNPTKPSDCE